MAHKIEPAVTGRASCRGCKQTIAKGELRFGEEFANAYSEEPGMSVRYWHLACAAGKLANELREALAAYEGPIDDRAALEALIETHVRPVMPYAERAGNGRARCRACDETIKKGELRVAFERVYESPAGPQKGAAYTHPGCVASYLESEADGGRGDADHAAAFEKILANSKLTVEDMERVRHDIGTSSS
jgi:hypothetical protein